MNPSLTQRQVQILRIVELGAGEWDARRIDLTVDYRIGPSGSTVLAELEELARLGLLIRDDSRGGLGGRWAVSLSGLKQIEEGGAND